MGRNPIQGSGGGGGSGQTSFPSTVPSTELVYYDDFQNYTPTTDFATRNFVRTTSGSLVRTQLGQGVVEFNTGINAGQGVYMSTDDIMGIFNSERKQDGIQRWGAQNAKAGSSHMMTLGFNEFGFSGINTTDVDTFETNLGVGAWFRFDNSVGANWQAVAVDGTVAPKTVIDTGVVPATDSTAMQEFRIVLEPDLPSGATTGTTTWFIDGVQVAQTKDNFPVGPDAGPGAFDEYAKLKFFSSLNLLGAGGEAVLGNLDYWYVLGTRDPQPVEGD